MFPLVAALALAGCCGLKAPKTCPRGDLVGNWGLKLPFAEMSAGHLIVEKAADKTVEETVMVNYDASKIFDFTSAGDTLGFFAFGGKLAGLMAARFPNFAKSCFAAFSMVANSDISGALLPGAMLGLGASLAVVLVHIAVFLLAAYDFEA